MLIQISRAMRRHDGKLKPSQNNPGSSVGFRVARILRGGDGSACIPGRKQRKSPVKYDKRRYKSRNRIEIMFGRPKDWRRVATRYDRCFKVFLSATALAVTVIHWL